MNIYVTDQALRNTIVRVDQTLMDFMAIPNKFKEKYIITIEGGNVNFVTNETYTTYTSIDIRQDLKKLKVALTLIKQVREKKQEK